MDTAEAVQEDYLYGKIRAGDFRQRMYALGYTPEQCDDWLDELDEERTELQRSSQ